jgi:hypothetical protein
MTTGLGKTKTKTLTFLTSDPRIFQDDNLF